MSLPRRLARLESLLEQAAAKSLNPCDMSDHDLWLVILDQAGVPGTPENVAAHEAYNADHDETVWVQIDGTWIDMIANPPTTKPHH